VKKLTLSGLVIVIILSSWTPVAQAQVPSLRFGIGSGVVMPDSILTLKGIGELPLAGWLSLRTNFEISSLFGVTILPVDWMAMVHFGENFRPYLGAGVGLLGMVSSFGTTVNFSYSAVGGLEMSLFGPSSSLFTQVKLRASGERTTYQLDLGMNFGTPPAFRPGPRIFRLEVPKIELGMTKTFREEPIISVLRGATAYTLNRSELQIGDLSIPFHISQLRWIYVLYGLTDGLQLGTAIPENFLRGPNFSGKFHAMHLPASRIDAAVPFSFDLSFDPFFISLGGGMAMSWKLRDGLTLHMGMHLWFSTLGGFGFPFLYASADVDILPNMKLLGELNLYSFLEDPLRLRIGGLMRLSFINLKLTATLVIPTFGSFLNANMFFRF